jgi:hypothetical protein
MNPSTRNIHFTPMLVCHPAPAQDDGLSAAPAILIYVNREGSNEPSFRHPVDNSMPGRPDGTTCFQQPESDEPHGHRG